MITDLIPARGITWLNLLCKAKHHLTRRSPDSRTMWAYGAAFYAGVWLDAARGAAPYRV